MHFPKSQFHPPVGEMLPFSLQESEGIEFLWRQELLTFRKFY